MKEQHLFYVPELRQTLRLPEDEAAHALRVLRMKEGDDIWMTDGKGTFFRGTITLADAGRRAQCCVEVREEQPWQQPWAASIALAVAPTKSMDRMEWLAEKATEIGLNALYFLNCANSERKVLKTERIEKIVVSAMKQSHKGCKPAVDPLRRLSDFIALPFAGDKFIAHCYDPADISPRSRKPFLFDVLRKAHPALVLVGPEGDFSLEEVRAAEAAGFQSVHLGQSRLRTETAALVAVQLMNLKQSL